ncbi:MAG TPA: D-alanyl-D-alanine carboxypeptidase/D-alanyl-D-alanine-endopeptidase, partial [Planctomycetota bacterium]|nr:D-alanyl-D-alanine carboxypeptidase/D-alanyl-D-alanine-endopeptidase [Planctomycetota bacterium]
MRNALALGLVTLALGLAAPARADGLADRLERIFAHPDFAGAKVGVSIVSLADGKTLWERDPGEPLSLASNTKLVTTAAALDRLGPGYRFETTLLRRGPVRVDTLAGDLVVRGGGDPCVAGRFDGEADGALRRFARSLREMGVRKVSGDVVADDRFLDREWQHPDWPKDQADRWYEAPVCALSLNDGCVDVSVAPGARAGAPALVTLAPACSLVEVENACVTTAQRKEHVVDIGRRGGGNRIVVRGAILAGAPPTVQSIGVTDPALLFAAVLKERLADEGIAVEGKARVVAADEPAGELEPVAVHASLLAQALPVVNKRSQTHYAEQLRKVLGAAKGGEGSWKGGIAVEAAFLEQEVGLEKGSFSFLDGSGLARGNKVSAR